MCIEKSRYVIITDPYSSGLLYVDALKKRGIGCVALLSNKVIPAFFAKHFNPDLFDKVFIYEGDLDKLAHCVLQKMNDEKPSAILAGVDTAIELTDKLANIFDLFGNSPETSDVRRNKYAMQERIKAIGLSNIKQNIFREAKLALAWLKQHNITKCVIKPVDSAGSEGVFFANSPEEVLNYFKENIGQTNLLGNKNEMVMVQEFLEGQEFVVDSVSCEGKHFITNICRYKKIERNGSKFVYREMRFVDPSDYPELCNYILSVLDALDFKYGPCHSEIMLTKAGPVLIEVGARLHGGFGPRIVEQCSSHSLINLSLDAYLDPEKWLSSTKEPAVLKQVAVEHFFVNAKRGRLSSIKSKQQIESLKTYLHGVWPIQLGSKIFPTTDLSNAPGWVVLTHPDQEQIAHDQKYLEQLEKDDQIYEVDIV